MDSDLSDIQKIQNALGGAIRDSDSSVVEYNLRCDSADGYSVASSYQQHLTPQAEHSFSILEELTSDSLDDDRLVINQLEPSLENALCLNKAYQSMLVELSQQLDVLRIVNQRKQKALQEEIEMLTVEANKKPEKHKKRKVTFSFFGMPYFKDAEYNCAPKNEDTLLADTIGFRNIAIINVYKPFSKHEVRKLRTALKEQALTIEANRLIRLREDLQNQLTYDHSTFLSDDDRKAIESQIETIQRQIYDVNSLPEEKLCDQPPTMFDWQKLAVENFRRSRTPDQLRLHWLHYLRPGVNCRAWTVAENRHLKELVKSYENGIDWEELTTKLNTNRTAFECFRRYQERFGDHRKFGWTKEDNKHLLTLIGNYGDQNMSDIDWDEMRLNFPGRSKAQIYAHFRYHLYCLDPSPFTLNEDTVILEGVKMGYDLSDISLLLGKRSSMQVRNRYNAIKNKGKGLEKAWTERENNLLLAMKDTSNLRAHVMRRDFPGRTFAQLFSRYHYLRMKFTTPKKYIEDLKGKLRSSLKSDGPKKNKQTASKILTMMSQFGYDREAKNSLKKTLPILKQDLLADKNKKPDPVLMKKGVIKPLKGKKLIEKKEKELKEILRPLMSINTKRPRKLSFPGDGREHGIILTSLYRLLQCNFTQVPEEEPSEEEMEELGIAPQNHLPFINLLSLTKDISRPNITAVPETILCLPPTLNTLTGFRGLLLHRKYLQSSASCEYILPERDSNRVTITECTDETTTSSNRQSETVPMETNAEEMEASPSDYQENISFVGTDVGPATEFSGVNETSSTIDSHTIAHDRENSQVISDTREENGDNVATSSTLITPSNVEYVSNSTQPYDEPMSEEDEIHNMEDSTIESADQVYDNSQSLHTSSSDSEVEEENEGETFGDRMADSLLLSRLLTLFYWPGIMSTMHVPDELKQKQPVTTVATTDGAEKDPLSISSEEQPTPSKSPVSRRTTLTKKELKEKRRAHMMSIVNRRYGKTKPAEENSGEAEASTSGAPLETEDTSTTSAGPVEAEGTSTTPPPAKKNKEAPKTRKRNQFQVAQSDRVTRKRRGTTDN